jgi:mono/diheme cytochrome c family protein
MMLASPRFHVQRRRATMALAWCAPLVLTMLMSLGATDAYAVADPSAIAAGKYLADIGGCESCHTAPNGKPFAGGLYMDTPYGPISTPNITPDKETGIGSWSDAQFYKALHDGIGQHGEYLYPVMPFPYYTKLSRDDVSKIRAYIASLPAVHNVRPPNKLHFPFSVRESLVAWRAVFFKAGEFKPDPQQSEQINRGAYLIEGLAHCGECHNARPVAGASKYSKAFQGGVIDNWYAPNITGDARDGIGAWSNDELATYLRTGVTPDKGVAAGPMAETVHNLSQTSAADMMSMVAYLKSTKATPEPHQQLAIYKGRDAIGSQTYLNYCASCHGVDGKGIKGAVPALQGNGAVDAKGPENVIQVVLGGLPAQGSYAAMPAVGAEMSDDEVASVTTFVRQLGKNSAPGGAEAGMVGKDRAKVDTLMSGGLVTGCHLPDDASNQAAQSEPVQTALKGMTDAQMLSVAKQLVAAMRRANPKASEADLVNNAAAAYCNVLHADTSLDNVTRASKIGQFSELVYMESNPHNHAMH